MTVTMKPTMIQSRAARTSPRMTPMKGGRNWRWPRKPPWGIMMGLHSQPRKRENQRLRLPQEVAMRKPRGWRGHQRKLRRSQESAATVRPLKSREMEQSLRADTAWRASRGRASKHRWDSCLAALHCVPFLCGDRQGARAVRP